MARALTGQEATLGTWDRVVDRLVAPPTTVAALRGFCRSSGIRGFSGMNKEELAREIVSRMMGTVSQIALKTPCSLLVVWTRLPWYPQLMLPPEDLPAYLSSRPPPVELPPPAPKEPGWVRGTARLSPQLSVDAILIDCPVQEVIVTSGRRLRPDASGIIASLRAALAVLQGSAASHHCRPRVFLEAPMAASGISGSLGLLQSGFNMGLYTGRASGSACPCWGSIKTRPTDAGVLASEGFDVYLVRPSDWKHALGLKNQDKDSSRELAMEALPCFAEVGARQRLSSPATSHH